MPELSKAIACVILSVVQILKHATFGLWSVIGTWTLQAPEHHSFCIDARPAMIGQVARSIATEEGWGNPRSIARRQANPGCIRYAGQSGTRPGRLGYAVFEDAESGWRALVSWIERRSSMPIGEALEIYNPGVGYPKRVLRHTSITSDTVIEKSVFCD